MIVLSQSKMKAWKRCPMNYYYKEVEKIEQRLKPVALERGTIIHEMLELWYKGEKKWKKPLKEYQKIWDKLMDEEKDYYGGDLPNECERMVTGYIKKYKNVQEKPLAIELDFTENPVEILPGIAFKGKIDMILKDLRGIWIVEHKTHKKFPSEEQRFLDMQTVIYILVAEKLGYKVNGVLWNYIRTKAPTIPKVLASGKGLSVAKDIDTDYDTYYQAIIDNDFDPDDYKEILERVKRNEFYKRRYMPRNERVIQAVLKDVHTVAIMMDKLRDYPFRALNKMVCNGCSYKSLCQAEMLGLDSSMIRRNEYKTIERHGKEVEEREKDDE